MTYCLAIQLKDHLIFAADSRTSAGVDNVTVYSKMHQFPLGDDRLFIALTAGNLATTQAVLSRIQRDLDNPHADESLRTADYMFDAAHYIGRISRQIQDGLRSIGYPVQTPSGEVDADIGGLCRENDGD